jgi:hypothetical protein
VRAHWKEFDYWRWMWHRRVRSELKIAFGVVVLLLLLGGGWFAADRLTTARASVSSTDAFVLETTVKKIVTVRERGKIVRKIVPVVKRVYLPRETAIALQTKYQKQLVTAPGTVHVVRRLVTTYVPVVKKQLVKVNGKTRTVVRTQLVPTTRVETQIQTQIQTRAVTNLQTVTDQQTITNNRTSTQTQTQTLPAQTVTQTQTLTVTQTQTQTVNNTTTEVVTQTTTVQVPGPTETVTVTVTEPASP